MKTIYYTYKFRLKPTKDQQMLLEKHFGCVRSVYNCGLELKKWLYNEYGISIGKYELINQLKKTKQDENLKYLKEVNAQSLQQPLIDLDQAFKNFFNGQNRFPRFKSKNTKNSFRVPQGIKIENGKIYVNKFREGIKLIQHREIKGNIKQATFSRDPSGKYYVSIMVEKQYEPTGKYTGNSCGLDLGVKDLAITSNGDAYKNHKHLKQYEKKLKYNQRKLSKKKRGSGEYDSQRKRLSRLHEKVKNCRHDHLHKVSRELVDNNDIIFIEDLNVKGMGSRCKPKQDENGEYIPNGQNKKKEMNRNIKDVAWGTFVQFIEYKAEWDEKEMVKINRYFPSSKLCSNCGWKYDGLTLNERKWVCGNCGVEHDRDENAAINIENEGIRIINCGSGTDPQKKQKRVERSPVGDAMKPEAQSL